MNRRIKPEIKNLLEAAYRDFHSTYHRERDPISLAHLYTDSRDREVAAFFAALVSYGNVRTILTSAKTILEAMGPSPYRSLVDGLHLNKFAGFRHRFTTGEDLEIIAAWVSSALRTHGSIEAFFTDTPHPLSSPVKILLSDFVRRLETLPLPVAFRGRRGKRAQSLKYLLSDPERGSACKRLNMFLRWMVRKEDGIDFGLWHLLSPRQLVLPVDTHVLQALHALKWTKSKQATWKVGEEATEYLRLYSPEDPVRYDFALCHLSMAGGHVLDYFARQVSKTVTHASLER